MISPQSIKPQQIQLQLFLLLSLFTLVSQTEALGISGNISKHIGFQYNISSMYDTQPVIDIPEFYFNSALGISVNW
jgi:hypothetical protein